MKLSSSSIKQTIIMLSRVLSPSLSLSLSPFLLQLTLTDSGHSFSHSFNFWHSPLSQSSCHCRNFKKFLSLLLSAVISVLQFSSDLIRSSIHGHYMGIHSHHIHLQPLLLTASLPPPVSPGMITPLKKDVTLGSNHHTPHTYLHLLCVQYIK